MIDKDNLTKLQLCLCELRLEERRINSEIKNLVTKNKTVDFFQAKKLSTNKHGVRTKIDSISAKIGSNPDIIA